MFRSLQIAFNQTTKALSTSLPLWSQTASMSSEIPPQRLAGKTAIVTASTEGIGFAIARRLGLEGAQVVVSSRKADHVEKATNQLKELGIDVTGLVCHVGQQEDRKKLFEHTLDKFGKLDILISNAATNPIMGPIIETDERAWDKIFEINVKSAFFLAKDAVPHLIKQKGGSIVFISSIAGYQAFPMLGTYSVSKTALLGLGRALAIELASNNIRVNCVAPGIIETKFSSAISGEGATSVVPLGRIGQPDDVAGVVSFLVSKDGAYITGESMVPSGGMFSRL